MKKFMIIATAAIVVFAIMAGSASAYDRPPIRVYGLGNDQWGQTVTWGANSLKYRYPGIKTTYCFGAIKAGNEANSSWLIGNTRYWDKLVCGGQLDSGSSFALILDQKGPAANNFTIYRLQKATVSDLYDGGY
jgi:hypothetical protein